MVPLNVQNSAEGALMLYDRCSFFCLDAKERTKEKIKAAEKIQAELRFSALRK
jgi:hypothetical protein